MAGGQGSGVLQRGMRQEFLRAEGAAANFGQWAGEVLAELHAQEELAHAALTESWGRQWTALLVQWLSWDPLSAVDVAAPSAAGPSDQSRQGGAPPVVGEVLPGFPGVAVP